MSLMDSGLGAAVQTVPFVMPGSPIRSGMTVWLVQFTDQVGDDHCISGKTFNVMSGLTGNLLLLQGLGRVGPGCAEGLPEDCCGGDEQ